MLTANNRLSASLQRNAVALSLALAAAVFAVDFVTPLGVAQRRAVFAGNSGGAERLVQSLHLRFCDPLFGANRERPVSSVPAAAAASCGRC